MKNKAVLIGASIVFLLIAFFAGSHFYNKFEENRLAELASEKAKLFVRDYSPIYGNKDAKVTLVEFLDPECESCRQFYPLVKQVITIFEGKVRLVVRYAPFHGNSNFAIKIIEAARKQGKYWEALELLFTYQPNWGNHHNPQPELIWTYLPEAGIDVEQIKKDMEDPAIMKIIEQDSKDLEALNVRGTPTFFVNGKGLNQFGMDPLIKQLSAAVKEAYGDSNQP